MKPFHRARAKLFGPSAREVAAAPAAAQQRSSAKRLEEREHLHAIPSVSAAAAAETAAWIERWKAATPGEREAMLASGLKEPDRADYAFAARASDYAEHADEAERHIRLLRSQLAATGSPRLRLRKPAAELAATRPAMACSRR